MIKGDPKRTILVDIDRVLCPAGEMLAFPTAGNFVRELSELGDVYAYSSRDIARVEQFLRTNQLAVEGIVEKPNPLAIIDDKAETCYGPANYQYVLECIRRRKEGRRHT